MQGKGLSDQQAKIYPPPGNRLPEGSRLPEQWQPTDDDLLHLVLQQPLITLIELLRQLWPALPYRALPGEDSATQTRRRWRPLAPGGRITTATAAAWLRAQLRRLHRTGFLTVERFADGLGYLPAGLRALHRPAPVALVEVATGERVELCPHARCFVAPSDLDREAQPWARVRMVNGMGHIDYLGPFGQPGRVCQPETTLGAVVGGLVLVQSDPDHPRLWWVCDLDDSAAPALPPAGAAPAPPPLPRLPFVLPALARRAPVPGRRQLHAGVRVATDRLVRRVVVLLEATRQQQDVDQVADQAEVRHA